MPEFVSRIILWWKRRRHAVDLVRRRLVTESRPLKRLGGIWVQYRVAGLHIVGVRYGDEELPLRTYFAVDPDTNAVEQVSWTEVRRLVPNRKSMC